MITYLSHLGERNPSFVEWTENEVKPVLDFKALKTTNIKTPNCRFFFYEQKTLIQFTSELKIVEYSP